MQPALAGHTDAGPGRALTSLVAIGRRALSDESRAPAAAVWGVSPAWLDALAADGDAATRALAAQQVPAPARPDLGAALRWRGLAVILLRRVLGAFAAGRAVDGTIPELAPRYLRGVLAPKRKKKAPADATKPAATKPARKVRKEAAAPAASEVKPAASEVKPAAPAGPVAA